MDAIDNMDNHTNLTGLGQQVICPLSYTGEPIHTIATDEQFINQSFL